MVTIGYRPVLWHVMKYYAHFGHKDFILCLGYRADAIKQYFLRYDECVPTIFHSPEAARIFSSLIATSTIGILLLPKRECTPTTANGSRLWRNIWLEKTCSSRTTLTDCAI